MQDDFEVVTRIIKDRKAKDGLGWTNYCHICGKIFAEVIGKDNNFYPTNVVCSVKCQEKAKMIKVLSEVKWQEHQKNMKTN